MRSEIGAVVLWIVASLVLAAILAPWLTRGGQWLAVEAGRSDLPGIVEWLAESCGRAKFSRFFNRSLMVSALMLLPFVIGRVRHIRRVAPGSCRVGKVPSVSVSLRLADCVAGWVIASGLLAVLCIGSSLAGAYEPRPVVGDVAKFTTKVIVPALVTAPLEEWLFRGILLGLWLRFVRPVPAVAGAALMFAFLHFLDPPKSMVFEDPRHPLAGFQLLGGVLLHFTEPRFFVTDFLTLLLVGVILGWMRLRTGTLWFGIGLHAGWVFALKACSFFYSRVDGHPLRPWWLGENLRSGVLPLLTLALTLMVCFSWLRMRDRIGISRASGSPPRFS